MAAVCWLRVEPGYVKYSIGKLKIEKTGLEQMVKGLSYWLTKFGILSVNSWVAILSL